jgi:tetratricopeptide (TPR) repeat protein
MNIRTSIVAILFLLVATTTTLLAQNTIGGEKREVPQAELERQTRFLDAEGFRMLGKYDKAIEAYKKFLYDNDREDAAWYGLARCYTDTKAYGNALDAINKAIQHSPDNKWYYIHKADIYERNAQPAVAADTYEQLLKKHPNTPEFLERLAYLSILSENPKRGLKALEQLEQRTGVSEITASKKHLVYVALGDNNKAANELRKLCDAYPTQLDYKRTLAKFYQETSNAGAAKGVWEEILKQNPTDAEAKLGALGNSKATGSGSNAKLEAMLPLFKDPAVPIDNKIKELAPYFAQLKPGTDAATVNGLLALGAALETLHKDDAKAWSASGDLYYLLDRNDEALERYRRCIALRPKVFSVWDNALTILGAQKKYADMLPLAEKAMDAFPNQPKAYYWYGVAANASKKPSDAQSALEQAQFMCGNNNMLFVEVSQQLAVALLAQNKPDDAIAQLEKALAKGGNKHAPTLETYGNAWAAKGDQGKAKEWWEKAKAVSN